jgi:hypothetical protein
LVHLESVVFVLTGGEVLHDVIPKF